MGRAHTISQQNYLNRSSLPTTATPSGPNEWAANFLATNGRMPSFDEATAAGVIAPNPLLQGDDAWRAAKKLWQDVNNRLLPTFIKNYASSHGGNAPSMKSLTDSGFTGVGSMAQGEGNVLTDPLATTMATLPNINWGSDPAYAQYSQTIYNSGGGGTLGAIAHQFNQIAPYAPAAILAASGNPAALAIAESSAAGAAVNQLTGGQGTAGAVIGGIGGLAVQGATGGLAGKPPTTSTVGTPAATGTSGVTPQDWTSATVGTPVATGTPVIPPATPPPTSTPGWLPYTIGPAIGGAAAVIGAQQQGNAIQSAAQTQANASNAAIQAQQNEFNKLYGTIDPNTGLSSGGILSNQINTASNALTQLKGVAGLNVPTYQDALKQAGVPSAIPTLDLSGLRATPTLANAVKEYADNPLNKFLQDTASLQVQESQAAKGGYFSGETGYALTKASQDLALAGIPAQYQADLQAYGLDLNKILTQYGAKSNEYQTALNNAQDLFNSGMLTQGAKYNQLAGLAGIGQSATNQLAATSANQTNALSNLLVGQGANTAASTIAGGQNMAQLYGNLSNLANTGMSNYLASLKPIYTLNLNQNPLSQGA